MPRAGMQTAGWVLSGALVLAACEAAPIDGSAAAEPKAACCAAAAAKTEQETQKQPDAAQQGAEGRAFGGQLALSAVIPVADVLADPAQHLGNTLQCVGIVARVCERAGCWLELRAESAAPEQPGLRVPMAGHAFFIPQDAVGRKARVEGKLTARELGEGERAHLEGEGLKAIGPLSLAATAVVVY